MDGKGVCSEMKALWGEILKIALKAVFGQNFEIFLLFERKSLSGRGGLIFLDWLNGILLHAVRDLRLVFFLN